MSINYIIRMQREYLHECREPHVPVQQVTNRTELHLTRLLIISFVIALTVGLFACSDKFCPTYSDIKDHKHYVSHGTVQYKMLKK
jgi:hypothetical protein